MPKQKKSQPRDVSIATNVKQSKIINNTSSNKVLDVKTVILVGIIVALFAFILLDRSGDYSAHKRPLLALSNSQQDKEQLIDEIDASKMSPLVFLHHFVRLSKPIVIKQGAAKWPALTKWKDDDYLVKKVGKRKVSVEQSNSNVYNWFGNTFKPKTMSFFSFFKQLISSSNVYLTLCSGNNVPELLDDIIEPEFSSVLYPAYDKTTNKHNNDNNKQTNTNKKHHLLRQYTSLWIGKSSQVSKLHYDEFENLFVMVRGTKYWTLYDPTQSDMLYPMASSAADGSTYSRAIPPHSPIDIHDPDYNKFPKFKDAIAYTTTLEEGDILYIPFGWWHQVESSDDVNIGFNFWFEPISVLLERELGYWYNQLPKPVK